MSRRMSCSLTVDAVRARAKTVTRRHVDTWRALKPGDQLTLIEKGMGLPKGARQVVLATVTVVDVRDEPVRRLVEYPGYGRREVTAEGFPDADLAEWAAWWCKGHGLPNGDGTLCRRIEWRYNP